MNQTEITALIEAEQRSAIVDELGALDAELAPFKQKQSRRDELAKIVRGWYAAEHPDLGFVIRGKRFIATLSAKELESTVDMKGAFKALGRVKFLQICGLTLKALQDNLAASIVAGLVSKARTGSRKLIVQPFDPPPGV